MKVLVTGSEGQLGQALIAQKPNLLLGRPIDLIKTARRTLNLADSEACKRLVKEQKPDWIINAGAYTNVDQAEKESELAMAVNAEAPKAFAESLQDCGGRLLQLSTDFVFNGQTGKPYNVDAVSNPLGVYGLSKAIGEKEVLRFPGNRLMRTSWLYGPQGNNFCLTMLRLHASKANLGDSINVVADQVGCPTSTYTLASACWKALAIPDFLPKHRRFHWSDAGAASWYDFAIAIGEIAVDIGLLENCAEVIPIRTADYPTPATRPTYSLLNCDSSYKLLALKPLHWRRALGQVMQMIMRKKVKFI